MTRKQKAQAQRDAYVRARHEGRVIRYTQWDNDLQCEQYSFVAYPTQAQADATLRVQLQRIAAGDSIHIGANIAPTA